ncbi:TasA family protein [Nocardioides abyssi]|uniref:TasA family protein n=1 Tax=Nocardioides abyssi TaxID=3058370 RepID=A0ABT8EV13_9ACTN|nr:TasA family protein [Nocardioides abyssi]MDN4161944.1 TasA family protein [Nocardioides abyssi]
MTSSTGTRKATTSTKISRKNRRTAAKIVASVALVAGAASVAGLGTFGAFTSTTSATESVAAGTIKLSSTQGVQGPALNATGLVPGDTVQRDLTLTRGATDEKFGSLRLTTTAATANLLSTDATNGLRLALDQCSVPWVKGTPVSATGTTPLTCPGTTQSVLANSPVVQANVDLPHALTTLNAETGRTSYLKATLTLPTAAGNDFQGLANTINLTFDATQRANENR